MVLMDLLPHYYANSPEAVGLQSALQTKADAMWDARDDLFSQFYVATATWGLTAWEKMLRLEVDPSKSYEYRRSRVMSKLRGQGTTTKSMLKNVAESFSHGKVDIIEHSGQYGFDIKFVDIIGMPPNMDDLTAALEEIKPAHLAYTYVFVYRTHNGLEAYTHAQLHNKMHQELRSEGSIDV